MHKAACAILHGDAYGLFHAFGLRLNRNDNVSGFQFLDMPLQNTIPPYR